MPTYLQEHFHLTQGSAGLIATGYLNVASILGLVVGGIWADRWGLAHRRACILVTAIGLCAAAPGVMLIASTHLLPLAIAGLVLYGLASAFTGTEMMPILCLVVDPRYRATGFGILNLCACMVGGATIYAGGVLRDAHFGVEALFSIGAIGMVLCAGLLLLIKERPNVAP
jgi:MFS family permease